MNKPDLHPFSDYFKYYISLVEDKELIPVLQEQGRRHVQLISSLSQEQVHSSYAPGKWSVGELIMHIIDTERIMCFRALSFARGHQDALPGFDHEGFVAALDLRDYTIEQLANEYAAQREATMVMFEGFSSEAMDRSGVFSSDLSLSVHGLGYLIAGHELHHLGVLKDKYGVR